jgi:hypothetical protein
MWGWVRPTAAREGVVSAVRTAPPRPRLRRQDSIDAGTPRSTRPSGPLRHDHSRPRRPIACRAGRASHGLSHPQQPTHWPLAPGPVTPHRPCRPLPGGVSSRNLGHHCGLGEQSPPAPSHSKPCQPPCVANLTRRCAPGQTPRTTTRALRSFHATHHHTGAFS